MKKIFLIMAMLLLAIILTACADNINEENETIALSNSMFDGFKVDLAGIQSLGLVQNDANQGRVNLSTAISPIITTLVSIDQNGQQRPIYFTNQDRLLNQDDFEGWITKLHITDRFIIFMVSTLPTTRLEYTGLNYDVSEYLSDENNQTFLIDRSSGLIYSLAAFPIISSINGNIINVHVGDDHTEHHLLSLYDGHISFTNLMPNPNIVVVGIFEFGDYVFVINERSTERIGNIIYIDGFRRWATSNCGALLVHSASNHYKVFDFDSLEATANFVFTSDIIVNLMVDFTENSQFYSYTIHGMESGSLFITREHWGVRDGFSSTPWLRPISIYIYSPQYSSTSVITGFFASDRSTMLGNHIVFARQEWGNWPHLWNIYVLEDFILTPRDPGTFGMFGRYHVEQRYSLLVENAFSIVDMGDYILANFEQRDLTTTYAIRINAENTLEVVLFDEIDHALNNILVIMPLN